MCKVKHDGKKGGAFCPVHLQFDDGIKIWLFDQKTEIMGYRFYAEDKEEKPLIIEPFGSDCIAYCTCWKLPMEVIFQNLYKSDAPDWISDYENYYRYHEENINVDEISDYLETHGAQIIEQISKDREDLSSETVVRSVEDVTKWFKEVKKANGTVVLC